MIQQVNILAFSALVFVLAGILPAEILNSTRVTGDALQFSFISRPGDIYTVEKSINGGPFEPLPLFFSGDGRTFTLSERNSVNPVFRVIEPPEPQPEPPNFSIRATQVGGRFLSINEAFASTHMLERSFDLEFWDRPSFSFDQRDGKIVTPLDPSLPHQFFRLEGEPVAPSSAIALEQGIFAGYQMSLQTFPGQLYTVTQTFDDQNFETLATDLIGDGNFVTFSGAGPAPTFRVVTQLVNPRSPLITQQSINAEGFNEYALPPNQHIDRKIFLTRGITIPVETNITLIANQPAISLGLPITPIGDYSLEPLPRPPSEETISNVVLSEGEFYKTDGTPIPNLNETAREIPPYVPPLPSLNTIENIQPNQKLKLLFFGDSLVDFAYISRSDTPESERNPDGTLLGSIERLETNSFVAENPENWTVLVRERLLASNPNLNLTWKNYGIRSFISFSISEIVSTRFNPDSTSFDPETVLETDERGIAFYMAGANDDVGLTSERIPSIVNFQRDAWQTLKNNGYEVIVGIPPATLRAFSGALRAAIRSAAENSPAVDSVIDWGSSRKSLPPFDVIHPSTNSHIIAANRFFAEINGWQPNSFTSPIVGTKGIFGSVADCIEYYALNDLSLTSIIVDGTNENDPISRGNANGDGLWRPRRSLHIQLTEGSILSIESGPFADSFFQNIPEVNITGPGTFQLRTPSSTPTQFTWGRSGPQRFVLNTRFTDFTPTGANFVSMGQGRWFFGGCIDSTEGIRFSPADGSSRCHILPNSQIIYSETPLWGSRNHGAGNPGMIFFPGTKIKSLDGTAPRSDFGVNGWDQWIGESSVNIEPIGERIGNPTIDSNLAVDFSKP